MKHYIDSNGFQYGIPDDAEPNSDWVEIAFDATTFTPDPNYKIPYNAARQNNYPLIGEQLDLLYHDIKSGLFGEDAKNSEWYKSITTIKETYPKD